MSSSASVSRLIWIAALATALAGCGLGAGTPPSSIQLTVTDDFGAHVLQGSGGPLKVVGQETVMSLLMRNYTVETRFGGGFVQSINALSGDQQGSEPVAWFYYVNGLQAVKGAAATDVHAGDHIWWDRHDWSQTEDVPAVVGSYPEPFLNGYGGKRYPVRIGCASVTSHACRAVTAQLRGEGVPAAIAAVGGGPEPEVLQVVVGPWKTIVSAPGALALRDAPGKSGVYARFGADGSKLTLLDANGRAVRTLSAGAGLVAATRQEEEAPVWVITGTDEAGVNRAAEALNSVTLDDHFAVALAPQGAVPVPVVER